MAMNQGRWWILTIPAHLFIPFLPEDVKYIKGQLEQGEGGFIHWQVVVNLHKKSRLKAVKAIFGREVHCEATRSEAAVAYVWKDDTAVPNTRFELGSQPVHRGDPKDWDAIWESASKGDLMAIPADVRVRQYNSLKRIAMDNCEPVTIDRSVRARL